MTASEAGNQTCSFLATSLRLSRISIVAARHHIWCCTLRSCSLASLASKLKSSKGLALKAVKLQPLPAACLVRCQALACPISLLKFCLHLILELSAAAFSKGLLTSVVSHLWYQLHRLVRCCLHQQQLISCHMQSPLLILSQNMFFDRSSGGMSCVAFLVQSQLVQIPSRTDVFGGPVGYPVAGKLLQPVTDVGPLHLMSTSQEIS